MEKKQFLNCASPDQLISTQNHEFFKSENCKGQHWILVVKIEKLTGDFYVGVNSDTFIFSEYEDDVQN